MWAGSTSHHIQGSITTHSFSVLFCALNFLCTGAHRFKFCVKKWITNVYTSTLKLVLLSRNLCYFYCIFLFYSFLLCFSVTDFLYRNHYSSLTLFFVRVLTPLPFQYFYKHDRDYSADDKTHKTLAQFFARKHFLFFYKLMLRSFAEEIRVENGQTKPVFLDCCSVAAVMLAEELLSSMFL